MNDLTSSATAESNWVLPTITIHGSNPMHEFSRSSFRIALHAHLKPLLSAVVSVGVLWGALAVGAQAATLEEVKAKGVLNVATEDSYYPFEFIKDGESAGFHKDVIT